MRLKLRTFRQMEVKLKVFYLILLNETFKFTKCICFSIKLNF